MVVSKCEKCVCYERRTWTTDYKPANYHRIGVSHSYAFCKLFNQRCGDIKLFMCKKYGIHKDKNDNDIMDFE